MISLAHIISPVVADPESDLLIAQPITFSTMETASEFSRGSVNVSLFAVQFRGEPLVALPHEFIRVPDLTRSVVDLKKFEKARKLPLIKDILDRLYQTDRADYMIYTNADIALQPYFYSAVSRIIEQGYDAFIINRRTIPGHYQHSEDIPLMYAEIGEPHRGYDCFVFRRDIYPLFKLGTICIGTAWIGRVLVANMVVYANKFREFRNAHLTFHIGDAMHWRQDGYEDYVRENHNEYMRIFNILESEHGEFNPVVRSYLLDTGDKRQFPDFGMLND